MQYDNIVLIYIALEFSYTGMNDRNTTRPPPPPKKEKKQSHICIILVHFFTFNKFMCCFKLQTYYETNYSKFKNFIDKWFGAKPEAATTGILLKKVQT